VRFLQQQNINNNNLTFILRLKHAEANSKAQLIAIRQNLGRHFSFFPGGKNFDRLPRGEI